MAREMTDAMELDEFVRSVEETGSRSRLERFIESLSLATGEKRAIKQSMRLLPALDAGASTLPVASPNLVSEAWWDK